MVDHAPVIVLMAPLFAAIAVTLAGLRRRGHGAGDFGEAPHESKLSALLTVAALAVSLGAAWTLLVRVIDQGTVRYFMGNWRSPLGIGIELRVDHLGALVVLMISAVALLTAIYSIDRVAEESPGKAPQFYAMYLLSVTGLIGMTIAGDAFNLYVLLEVASLSGYALVAMGSSKQASVAAFNYIIMGTIGASLYLLGVGYLYIKTGTLNMTGIREFIVAENLLDSRTIHVAFILILVAVWIKMAFFPLYGWLPNAYTFSPSTSSCLLAPLVTKVSVYVMIRMMLTVFGAGYIQSQLAWGQAVVWLATLAILAASFSALAQTNLKRMLSFLIIAEVGYMVGGAWLANRTGMIGAIYHVISDGAMTLCLFLGASILYRKTGQPNIAGLTGMFRKMPLTMAAFTAAALSMIGVPPTCGFFSKYYLIRGGMEAGHWEYVAALLISSLINAILFFRIIEVAYFKPAPSPDDPEPGTKPGGNDGEEGRGEAPALMLGPLVIAAVSLIIIGLFNAEIVEVITRTLDLHDPTAGGGG